MKVLLAYDGEEHSRYALDESLALAKNENAAITLLSVVTPDQEPSRFATGPRPHAREDVAAAHAYLRENGVESEMKIVEGDAADTIVDEAAAGGYDLLVTGSRGRGPVARMLLGSVSHAVSERTPCPLLVVGETHRVRVEPRK